MFTFYIESKVQTTKCPDYNILGVTVMPKSLYMPIIKTIFISQKPSYNTYDQNYFHSVPDVVFSLRSSRTSCETGRETLI